MPRRVPPDVARVLESFRDLGEAARRGLHLSEKATREEVRMAARQADSLLRRAKRRQ